MLCLCDGILGVDQRQGRPGRHWLAGTSAVGLSSATKDVAKQYLEAFTAWTTAFLESSRPGDRPCWKSSVRSVGQSETGRTTATPIVA